MIEDLNPFKVSIDEELRRNPELKVEDITNLQEWLRAQSHLPKISDEQLCQFLHACYYNTENTKSTLQHFFKYKSSMNEFFSGWDPTSSELITYVDKVLYAVLLPKNCPSEPQILVLKLNDTALENYDFAMSVKWLIMTVSRVQMEHGIQPAFILVYDATGYTFSHALKNPLSLVKNYIQFGKNASSIRVTEIHFINSSTVVKKLISLIKPFLDKNLMKMITFHASSETFFKNIPTTRIPTDYGGTARSIAELHHDNIKQMKIFRMEMMAQERLNAKDNKKTDKSKPSAASVGHSFRHLELD